MSDTATSVQINADALSDLAGKIGELDTKIASASGNDSAARKSFIEQVTNEHADDVNTLISNLLEQLKAKEPVILVGLVTRLNEALKTDLEPVVNTWVDAEFPKTKVDSTVDVGALKEERKSQLTLFKALREVLNTFKIKNDHIPDPKRSGGGRPIGSTTGSGADSKTGLNKEGYRYLLDGKKRPKSQNSLSSLCYYSTEGVPAKLNPDDKAPPKRMSTKELKGYLKEHNIDFGPQDTWEIELPNGKKIGASRFSDADKVEFGIDPAGESAPVDPTATPAVPENVGA